MRLEIFYVIHVLGWRWRKVKTSWRRMYYSHGSDGGENTFNDKGQTRKDRAGHICGGSVGVGGRGMTQFVNGPLKKKNRS